MILPFHRPSGFNRREFLQVLAAGGLAAGLEGVRVSAAENPPAAGTLFQLGVCTSVSNWEAAKKAGCDFVEESVGKLLNPGGSDEDFAKAAAQFKSRGVPVLACNGFLPAELKLVGPSPRHDEVVEYATRVLQRAGQLGVRYIVLGSGGARRVPDGFDKSRAEEQFVAVTGRIGKAAEAAGVTVALESLNRGETNFGNTLRDCLRLVDAINSPRVRLVADLYHMLREDEGPEALAQAGAKVVHCHVAEKAQRTPPGTAGDDFKPYLRALKKAGFRGGISLECRWKDFGAELAPAILALRKQVDAVAAET
jgi:sugar phosphate isomerase/epimerase